MKKKVLIFIDWYLPGYKAGGPIRSVANLIAHLSPEFDFSVITRNTDYCEKTPYPGVKSDEWNTLADGTRVYYISEDKLSFAVIRRIIRTTDFDVAYLNGIYSLYFTLIPLLLLRKKHNKRIVIAARGMLSEGSLKVKKAKKKFFIRSVKVLKLFDEVLFHSTTQRETEEIRAIFGNDMKVRKAGNLPQKDLIRNASSISSGRIKTPGQVKLVNIARIAPEKNLLYALQVLKQVKGEVTFDFYGPVYDQDYWSECKQELDRLPQNISAHYKGSLDSSLVQKKLEEYHFMLMPTTGENFGHIILQSLSAGCPVIISDRTPWKSLEEKKIGWDISLEEKDAFSRSVETCVAMGQARYDEMSAAAFEHAGKYGNDPRLLEENRALFR